MKKSANRDTAQLDMFRPRPKGPDWSTLPERDRWKAVELLAGLLMGHREGSLETGAEEETPDE